MRSALTNQFRQPFATSNLVAATMLAMALWETPAAAQTQIPQQIQTQARSLAKVCMTDFEQLCRDVQPGGGRILGCLSANAGKLSPSCRSALPQAQALAAQATAAGVMPK